MAKKVTGKELSKLIESVLSERKVAWPINQSLDGSDTFSNISSLFPGMSKSYGRSKNDLSKFMDYDDTPANTLDKDDFDVFFKPIIDFDIDDYDSKTKEEIEDMEDSYEYGIKDKIRTLLDFTHKSVDKKVQKYAKDILKDFFGKYSETFDPTKNSQRLLDGANGEATAAGISLPTYKPIADKNDASVSSLDNFVISFQDRSDLPWFLSDTAGNQPLPSKADKINFFEDLVENPSPEYLATALGSKIRSAALTGELIKDVIANPVHYRGKHTVLVRMIRVALDKAQETDATILTTNLFWKDLSDLLKNVPRTTDSSDASIGADAPIPQFPVTSNMAEEGYALKTSSLVIDIFEKSFGGSTVKDKIEKMQAFSEAFNNGLLSGEYYEQISNTVVLDFFRRVVQDFDASSSGFLFESFLALLFAGTKLGGNTRLEDFQIGGSFTASGNPQPVTLKLYQSGTKMTTSAYSVYEKFFSQNPSGTIKSIMGIKGEGDMSVTFHIKDITADMWSDVDATRNPSAGKSGATRNGLKKVQPSDGAMKLGVSVTSGVDLGTINFGFLSVEDDKFLEQAESAFTGAAAEIGQMFKFYNNFKINATKYLTNAAQDPNEAGNAIDTFNEMREKAMIIFNPEAAGAVKDTTEPIKGSSVTQRIAEEQKITANFLKKLIEESFKK